MDNQIIGKITIFFKASFWLLIVKVLLNFFFVPFSRLFYKQKKIQHNASNTFISVKMNKNGLNNKFNNHFYIIKNEIIK